MAGKVDNGFECPRCTEDDIDRLVWDKDGETVTCSNCGKVYKPSVHCFEVQTGYESEPTYVVDADKVVVTIDVSIPLEIRETLAEMAVAYLTLKDRKGRLTK